MFPYPYYTYNSSHFPKFVELGARRNSFSKSFIIEFFYKKCLLRLPSQKGRPKTKQFAVFFNVGLTIFPSAYWAKKKYWY